MRILWLTLCFLLLTSILRAEVNHSRLPGVNSHVSGAVFQSTGVTTAGVLIVSSKTASLWTAVVTQVGGAGSLLEMFDSSVSTIGTKRLLPPIDVSSGSVSGTASILPLPIFNLDTSSGIAINNTGSPAAKIGFIYRQK